MRILSILLIFSLGLHSLHAQLGITQGQRRKNPIPRDLEIMYTKGLKYLSSSQDETGAWNDSDRFGNFPGTVALCLLAFLAHGDDPNHGPYSTNIKKSLDYLISKQQKNGYIGSAQISDVRGNMYNHGFATLALAEAYGMLEDKRIGPALQKAVDLILTSQKRNPLGAWRYSPVAKDADSTVAGCQIIALYAARNAGIPVPDAAFKTAKQYMDTCRNKTDGAYGYTNPNGGRVTLTAIGVLCEALQRNKDTAHFKQSLAYLKENINHRDSRYPYYFEYYMSQALFQADETTWSVWNKKNIDYLKVLQHSDGSFNGTKGKALSTAGSLLSLALNYRFLPIYEK